jgi:CubicO group peptidase (beta-lactamase class C family)
MGRGLTGAAALLLGLGALHAAIPAAAQPAEPWARVDATLAALTSGPGAPVSGIAVLAVEEGRVVHRAAFGCALFTPAGDRCERALTVETPVRAASLSKLVVGVAALALVGQGRLDLEGDASDHLGFPLRNPAAPEIPITVRMLLDHSSSLRDGEVYGLPVQYGLEDLVLPGRPFAGPDRWATAAEAPGAATPGRWFKYTNLNYGVLATVMERVTGERFDAAVDDLVLKPLGVTAGFDVRRLPDDAFAALAPVYRRLKDGELAADGTWTPQVDDYRGRPPDDMVSPFGVTATAPLADYRIGANATTLSPQGGLRISAEGLGAVLRLMLADGVAPDGRQILAPGTVARMAERRWVLDTPDAAGDNENGTFPAWGIGIQCGVPVDHPDAGRWCGHMAEAYGLLGGLFFDAASGRGFVYLITGTGVPLPPDHAGPLSPAEGAVALSLLEALAGR